jgi:3-oxoacyl-[acyl-carrier protein] reductase
MQLHIDRKVALITGGSHGIGQATCVALARTGQTTTALVKRENVACLACKLDVDDETNVSKMVDETIRAYGRVDVLVNNVGGGSSWGDVHHWERTNNSVWHEAMVHNYLTTVWFTNEVLPRMVAQGFGRVVAISSIYGKEAGGQPWFGAAKAAQLALMKSYAGNPSFSRHGVTFNSVCPGFTDVGQTVKPFSVEDIKQIPVQRCASPDEIAAVVAFLCSHDAAYVNGASIVVAGGLGQSI